MIKHIVNRIQQLQAHGILNKLVQDVSPNATRCLSPEHQAAPELKALQMEDFYGIYCVYLAGGGGGGVSALRLPRR